MAEIDLAYAEIRDGAVESGRVRLNEAAEVAEKVGNVLALICLWSNLGFALVLMGEFDEAEVMIRRALIEYRRRGLGNAVGEATANLARCASGLGDPRAGVPLVRRS